MARNDPQMNLRVPVELKEKVEKAAFENGRTITAEAVYRLEKSFESEISPSDSYEFSRLQDLHQKQMQEIKALREIVEAFSHKLPSK